MKANLVMGVSLVLSACGGGGGGGGTPTPPTTVSPPEDVPLTVTSSNATDVATAGLSYSEAVLQLGETALDLVRTFPQSDPTDLIITDGCDFGGTLTVEWEDADSDRIVSAGDSFLGDFSLCYSLGLNAEATGEMRVDVDSRSSLTGPAELQMSLTITMDDFDVDLSNTMGSVLVSGTLGAESSESASALSLSVDTGVELILDINSAGDQFVERLRSYSATRSIDREQARYRLEANGEVRSQLLEGQINISTQDALAGYPNTYPDVGEMIVEGANNRTVTVRAIQDPDNATPDILFNDGASDTAVAAPPWADMVEGFMWWERNNAQVFQTGYRGDSLERSSFNFIFYQIEGPDGLLPNDAPTTNTFDAVPVPLGSEYNFYLTRQTDPVGSDISFVFFHRQQFGAPDPDIPGSVTIAGGRLTVVPETPLRAGEGYNLAPQGQLLSADLGETSSLPIGIIFTMAE